VQDEITEAVVSAVEPAMADAERQRAIRKPIKNLGGWELYHRGLWHFYKFTPADNQVALELLHKAATIDPHNAAVQVGLAWAYLNGGRLFAPHAQAKWLEPGLEHAKAATVLDPLDATAHAILGLGLLLRGEHDMAVRETMQAVALNESAANVQGLHALVLTYSGRSSDALPHVEHAIRFSPLDPLRWVWIQTLSMALYFLGDYEGSAAAGRDLSHMQPNMFWGYRALVAALAELGRIAEAHQYADTLQIKFSDEMRVFLSGQLPNWRERDYQTFVASLAKGGLVLQDKPSRLR
jgi:adenylate cyclase